MAQKSFSKISNPKLKRKIKTLNIIAICLLLIQTFGYLTRNENMHNEIPLEFSGESIAYYIGYNLWLIIAIILLIRTFSLNAIIKESDANLFLQQLLKLLKNPTTEIEYLLAQGYQMSQEDGLNENNLQYKKNANGFYSEICWSKKDENNIKEVFYGTTDKKSFLHFIATVKNNFIIENSSINGEERFMNFENDFFCLQIILTPIEGKACTAILSEKLN